MPARGHYITFLVDLKGEPLAGATVTVRQQGTAVPIAGTIYAAENPSAVVLANPLTADQTGKLEFFLIEAARVDLFIEHPGFVSRTVTIDVTQIGDITPHTLDPTDAHDASAISFIPTGTVAATDVQAAIAEVAAEAAGAITDHGALTGLGDDDHLQYLNNARGDARYSKFIDVQEFSGSGTWTKLAGAKAVLVEIWGGGNGGANGVTAASGVIADGGAGGGGGQMRRSFFAPTELGATEVVTIGAGGASNLGVGGSSSFGSHLSARGGGTGAAGGGDGTAVATPIGVEGAVAPAANTVGNGAELGGASGAGGGGRTATAPAGGSAAKGGAGGGGGGGKDTAAGTGKAGGAGGARGRVAGGGAAGGAAEGGAGVAGTFLKGGGGGAAHATGTGGAGGAGGAASGGGGGGGAPVAGAGGVGGAGFVRVTTYF